MLDPALLRPGRLEVHIEIGLPDEKGRNQIFGIHLKNMKDNGMLGADVKSEYLASQTKNFSGAEIEGLVKSAASFALYASMDVAKNGAKPVDVTGKSIVVRLEHFEMALNEVKAAFGVDEDELKMYLRSELLNYGGEYERILRTCQTLINQVRTSKATPLLSVLLEGPNGAGKTSLAAKLAVDSGFPVSTQQTLTSGLLFFMRVVQKLSTESN
jgi:vesicle-fusing ATPase